LTGQQRDRSRTASRVAGLAIAVALAFAIAPGALQAQSNRGNESDHRDENDHGHVRIAHPIPGRVLNASQVMLVGHAVVNLAELAKKQEEAGPNGRTVQPLLLPELEEPEEPISLGASPTSVESPTFTFATSPSPNATFMGLDDIPMADSSYIIIPPDTDGAVGPSRILQGLNNNYRVIDKSDGSVISTVGTATFWAPTGETELLGLTDPRTLYDPYNQCWITEMQTITSRAGHILIGVSQTSDPSGNWYLYRFAANATIDFPIVGFNKNWVVVAINRYSAAGTFQRGITLVLDYPQLRAGTGTGTLFTQATNSHFSSGPTTTYSATEETLFVVTHLSSSGGTYSLDWITGTPSSPVYTVGGTLTRPGGGWAQPGGNTLPQGAPNTGTSSCGSTPCPIESQDAQVRASPVFRDGFIYYTQTIGLPASALTHTGVQWTKITGSGAYVDGGRIDDPTATSTNGGKWYAYPHIGVNSAGDFMIGYSQFSSSQHPSAGYSMHLAGDPDGSLRDPVIYKTGEDYYHKDFGSGRNRWGDYSKVQVDPNDDRSLWTVQEYGKTRVGSNDGTSGINSSRWSTYWANVAGPPPTVTIAAGPSQPEGDSGLTDFVFTVDLSTAYSLPVIVSYETVDGTATVAGGDYQSASGSITIPAGLTSGTITVHVVGDTATEPDETFQVSLLSATNGVVGSPSVATGTIENDDTGYTITASAGPGGTITPSGTIAVAPGETVGFTIAADACEHIADVLVDGGSVGTVTSWSFPSVSENHTIAASFDPNFSISLGSALAFEGNAGTTNFDFPIQLSGPCTVPVDVTWQTADGTATVADNDYVPDTNVFSFPASVTSGTITVHVNGDITPEDAETFTVSLSNPSHAGIQEGQGTGTILNDDGVTGVGESAAVHELSFRVDGGNPTGAAIVFRAGLPAGGPVELSVFDVQGRLVASLFHGSMGPGYHTLRWNGRAEGGDVSSGVYFVRFTASRRTITRRIVLLR
jgi:hypothetical protein